MFPFPKGLAVLLSLSRSSFLLPGPEQPPGVGSLQKMSGIHTTLSHLCQTVLTADLGRTTWENLKAPYRACVKLIFFFKGLLFIKIWHGFLQGQ